MVAMRSTELYPTLLRSTGDGFIAIVGNLIGAGGPYIVFLVTDSSLRNNHASVYYSPLF